jgi:8-oxo-dGTP pyrophosphatase MutT (NUDIX family)
MQVKACGFLVVRGRPIDSFLLMQHQHRLDLPKGHLDAGETELECAYRELEEETGIRPQQIELYLDFRFTLQYTIREKRYGNQKVDKTLVIFLGRLLEDVPIRTTEHLGHEWRPWNPPHRIQAQTIDPLLAAAEAFFVRNDGSA